MPDPNWEDILKNNTVDSIDNLTPPTEEETRTFGKVMSAEDRQLNPNGYTLKVAVIYDQVWKAEFGAQANARVDAIMALVDEQYSESTFAVIQFSQYLSSHIVQLNIQHILHIIYQID